MAVTGRLSPAIWATRKAIGVHFCFESLNLTERKKRRESVEESRFEELTQLFGGSSTASA